MEERDGEYKFITDHGKHAYGRMARFMIENRIDVAGLLKYSTWLGITLTADFLRIKTVILLTECACAG